MRTTVMPGVARIALGCQQSSISILDYMDVAMRAAAHCYRKMGYSRIHRNLELLDEIRQEARIGLLHAATTWNADRATANTRFQQWAYWQVIFYVRDCYRMRSARLVPKNTTYRLLKSDDKVSPPEPLLQSMVNHELVQSFKKVLTWRERVLLTLRYHEDYTFLEISQVLSISSSFVSIIHSEIIRKISAYVSS